MTTTDASPKPEPRGHPIQIQFTGGSEVFVTMPKESQPQSPFERRFGWLAHPVVLPLFSATVLALGGFLWSWGVSWVSESFAAGRQAEKIQTEIQVRLQDTMHAFEILPEAQQSSAVQKSFLASADRKGVKLMEDTLAWKIPSEKRYATFPEFNQRTFFSLLRELQLLADARGRKKAREAEKILNETPDAMSDNQGLDFPGLNARLACAEHLIAPED